MGLGRACVCGRDCVIKVRVGEWLEKGTCLGRYGCKGEGWLHNWGGS